VNIARKDTTAGYMRQEKIWGCLPHPYQLIKGLFWDNQNRFLSDA